MTRHVYDDDAICIHCGFDGADAHIQERIYASDYGEDELRYALTQFDGDLRHHVECQAAPPRMPEHETVHIWPDGTECDPEDLQDHLEFMSDDFETVVRPPTNND